MPPKRFVVLAWASWDMTAEVDVGSCAISCRGGSPISGIHLGMVQHEHHLCVALRPRTSAGPGPSARARFWLLVAPTLTHTVERPTIRSFPAPARHVDELEPVDGLVEGRWMVSPKPATKA
jgi:hypothetical protein